MLCFINQDNFLIMNIIVQVRLIIFHFILIVCSRIIKVLDCFFLTLFLVHKLIMYFFIIRFEFILLLKLRLTQLINHLITKFNLPTIYYSFKNKLNHHLCVSLRYLCRLIIYLAHEHIMVILSIFIKGFYLIICLLFVDFDKLFYYE